MREINGFKVPQARGARALISGYISRELDQVARALNTKEVGKYSSRDVAELAQEYAETQHLSKGIPGGLDNFLLGMPPTTDEELALWMHVCLEQHSLIPPFAMRPNRMQPEHSSHFQFLADSFFERTGDCVVLGNRFGGKCVQANTPIMLYDGSTKYAKDIVPGDLLMGDDSQPRTVLSTTRGRGPMYKVTPVSGDPYVVNDAHILSLRYAQGAKVGGEHKGGQVIDISVQDYLALGKTHRELLKGYKVPVRQFGNEAEELPLPPYFLGIWLGDGTRRAGAAITTPEPEIVEYLYRIAEEYGLDIREQCERTVNVEYSTYFFKMKDEDRGWNNHPFVQYFRQEGLNECKFIPAVFKTAPWEDRLWILAGLLDTDGELVEYGKFVFSSKYKQLAEDVVFVARSLGLSAYISERQRTCTNASGGPKTGTYWYVYIGGDTYIIPTQVARKQSRPREIASNGRRPHNVLNVKISVEPCGEDDYYGFVIDGNRRFLLGDFTVTHNTVTFATLMFLEALYKPGIEISHLAAVQDQALMCYEYFLRFTRHELFSNVLNGKATMSRAHFKNDSLVKILVGTVSGVNSSHSTKVSIDEVELMEWNVLQEAMNMATSNEKWGRGYRYGQATRLTSSRKKATGTMQKIIDEAEERGFKMYRWNVWDTIQRCQIPPMAPGVIPVKDAFNDDKLVYVPEACMGCQLMQLDPPRCLGKARYSNGGVVKLSDIMAKARNLDNEVWQAQHECSKPGTQDLIYYMFNKGRHVIDYEDFLRLTDMPVEYAEFPMLNNKKVAYCPEFPVYAAQDAGYNCPATIFAQEIDDLLIVFDEIRMDRIAPSLYIADYLIPAQEAYDVAYWICDPAGITLYSDMELASLCVMPASNPLEEGIEAVRARLGANQLYFDNSCVNCKDDLMKYSRDIRGNIRRKTIFHYADCIRYLCMEFVAYTQVIDKVYT